MTTPTSPPANERGETRRCGRCGLPLCDARKLDGQPCGPCAVAERDAVTQATP
jgi:hypothetical protein